MRADTRDKSVGVFILACFLALAAGCAPFTDVSNDPSWAYNFATLIKGRCFRTKTASYLRSHVPFPPDMAPPGTVFTPDYPTTASLEAFHAHQSVDYVFPPGVEFQVSRLLRINDDTGGFILEGVIRTGEKTGLTVNVLDFFTPHYATWPGDAVDNEFIIGPYVIPCEGHYDRPSLKLNSPEAASTISLRINGHDPGKPPQVKFGAGVCVRLSNGQLLVLTAAHLAFSAERPKEMQYRPFDVRTGKFDGSWLTLGDDVDRVSDLRDDDLAVYWLKRPLPGVTAATMRPAWSAEVGAAVGAIGFERNDADDEPVGHLLKGTLDDLSGDRRALALSLHAEQGDSGAPIFQTGQLIGIVVSAGGFDGEDAQASFHTPFEMHCRPDRSPDIRYDSNAPPLPSDTIGVRVNDEVVTSSPPP
jgi:hypothetical protein